MIRTILLLLAMWGTPPTTDRRIQPEPEPAQTYRIYTPIVLAESEIMPADDLRPIYGYASPHRRTYDVPFYNWNALARDCVNPHFWPMVRGQTVAADMVSVCDNGQRFLLIYNEPELTHYPATPKQAAAFVHGWAAQWTGPIACCGNFYSDVGVTIPGAQWFVEFVEAYQELYGTLPPLAAMHIHIYEYRGLNVDDLRTWRAIADRYKLRIIITESGTFPSELYPPEDVAERLPGFLAEVESVLKPDVLMWFSDYLQPWILGGDVAWHNLNLTEVDGTQTVVGKAWQEWITRP